MKSKLFILLILFSNFATAVRPSSGSGFGNGGDPIFYYLEAARYSMEETINTILFDPDEKKLFCEKELINAEQKKFCKDFFFAVAEQIRRLKSPFSLSDDSLIVIGPDGKEMSVPAMTELGPKGFIYFHRDSIKLQSPSYFLLLMTHEFQHKVSFGGKFTNDNDPIGPFASGRLLIDQVAGAVLEVATRRGKIGVEFGINDNFSCRTDIDNERPHIHVGNSARMFLSPDLMSYESGMGRNDNDLMPAVPDPMTESNIIFRVTIREPENCASALVPGRSTHLQIVRSYWNLDPQNQKPDEILNSENLYGFNPMCDEKNNLFTLSYANMKFQCKYNGSVAKTRNQKLLLK